MESLHAGLLDSNSNNNSTGLKTNQHFRWCSIDRWKTWIYVNVVITTCLANLYDHASYRRIRPIAYLIRLHVVII